MVLPTLWINTGPSKFLTFSILFSDVASLMHIEKAITSGSVLVLHNVNENVDSIFLPLIYRRNTNTKDGVCDGRCILINRSTRDSEFIFIMGWIKFSVSIK
jgi:hypothetical protein